MTPPGRLGRLTGLAALDEALDPDRVATRLAPHPPIDGLRLASARLVGYRYGERAVVAYGTVGRDGAGPALIGKVYAEPARARRLHGLLEQLHALDAAGHGCGVARPVAVVAELGMSLYVAVPGDSIDRLAGEERRDAVGAAARWLAGLHRSRIDVDRRLDLAVEIRNLAGWADTVARHHPPAATATARLLGRVRTLAEHVRLSRDIPIHKDFHYQHALVDDGRLVVIDLDEVRAGDPAFDVAHFGANLRLLGLRENLSGDELTRLESTFLDAFSARTGYEPDARHDLFHAYTCLKIAKQLATGRGPAPAPIGAERARQVGLILREGLRCPR